jgi:hypothetical protein
VPDEPDRPNDLLAGRQQADQHPDAAGEGDRRREGGANAAVSGLLIVVLASVGL